ncbi:MAG: hypothetical protein ACQEQD_04510 [Bacillota bacterium]
MSDVVETTKKSQEVMEKGEKNGLWPKDLNSREKKQLAYISTQYGLDPFFNDLQVLGGNPYVTTSGLKRNAHNSDDPPVSIQLEKEQKKGDGFEYKAKLWKESTPEDRPFIEYGEASFNDVNLHGAKEKDIKAMARTRAINRVLRLAYNISLTSAEEMSGYNPQSGQIEDVTPDEGDNTTEYNNASKNEDMDLETAKELKAKGKKFKGKPLKDCPLGYLEWMAENWNEERLKDAAKLVYTWKTKEQDKINEEAEEEAKNRELTEKEKEIKDIIDGDDQLKKEMLNYMKEYEANTVDQLDDELYQSLKDLLNNQKKTDEEIAEEAVENDEFDTSF